VITVVLGGARSGKSEVAERLAARLPAPVSYLATATVTDDDMAERVGRHRQRRPAGWITVEAGSDLVTAVQRTSGSLLVDSLGTWVASTSHFAVDTEGLCDALRARTGDAVVVSEEVGLGVHPSTEAGRHFRDVLGTVNQRVAAVADEVLLVVAGRVLPLGPVP
jgi:adenosylcobinamide kinase / adenosylcobinamide-phosphate guanylyltransferase